MYRTNQRLVLSATDVVSATACDHLTSLSLAHLETDHRTPFRSDPMLKVLVERGLEHEQEYLAQLRHEGLRIVTIPESRSSLDELVVAREQTRDALAEGVDVVFQATFLDDANEVLWRGHADFVRRIEAEGEAHRYEPEDTKLARHVTPGAVLQLCNYAEHLSAMQGVEPDRIHVVLGGKERVTLRLKDFDAYYRAAKQRLLARVGGLETDTYPLPVEHCAVCNWASTCKDRLRADDHLVLVAGLSKQQASRLHDNGIATLTDLARSEPGRSIPKLADSTLRRLQTQSSLQVDARERPDEPPPYELQQPQGPGFGLEALPAPSPGDLYFDIESDPYAADGGLEYLFGVGWRDDRGEFPFRAFWAHSPAEEKLAFEELMDFFVERRRAYPAMHIYHYAPYEPAALGRLMGRHATREFELDDLLRGRVLVDLYRVVRQAMIIGTESYSLKKLEPFYMESRDATILEAGASVVEYERWLHEQDQQILDDLEEYNRDDCRSTMLLHDWLEERRVEAASQFGRDLERPPLGDEMQEAHDDDDEASRLAAELTSGIDVRPDESNAEAYATWLLAQLVQWHRREAKPEWWMYFHRVQDCTDEDLFDDTEAISGLEYEGVVDTVKRSAVHRYRFDPDQEHKIGVGTGVDDPASVRIELSGEQRPPGPGTVVGIDPEDGWIDLKRGTTSEAPHPHSLIPNGPIRTGVLSDALLALGTAVLTEGIEAPGQSRAARDILLRRQPRVIGTSVGPLTESAPGVDELTDIALRLDHSYLPVQGPPGTGKTYTSARAIIRLVQAGKRIGITANSHAVITNLLDEVMKAASEGDVVIRAVQKANDHQCSQRPDVMVTNSNPVVVNALAANDVDVVAGTQWLFARADMADTLDYLVIDEAGQLSMANVIAVSGVASNMILVGDPQQLAQPSKGSHPVGAGGSALDHLLEGLATIPADRGLFLEQSYRMHPSVCAFVSETSYESRLHSVADCENQKVDGDGAFSGSGLRWLPVEHAGNRTSSSEEADVIATIVKQLLGRQWTNAEGEEAELGLDDLLIVAPYNAQVNEIRAALPPGARVGTVDKFQGREGAVAIVSLAASSAEDILRGLEFLLSRNRVNVAVSRARAMSIVVGSAALLATRCRTVDQMRLVNGLCRFVELAQQVQNPPPR